MNRTINSLQTKHIAILDQPMDYGFLPYRTLVRNNRIEIDKLFNFNKDRYEIFKKLKNVDIVKSNKVFCDKTQCFTQFNNTMVYHDDNHLNNFGTTMLWDKVLVPYINNKLNF